uniref:Chromogranin-A n=1 Tax=Gasterosteus aculeatus TaxID=69293 RepID=G3PI64_GASAC
FPLIQISIMIARGLFVLTVLTNCVLSLPVTPGQLENDDVEVMKCIVEALADVLSRPQPTPVSEECLVTLKTDDRLVSVLRRHNFLKLLQDIAVQGHQERSAATPEPTAPTPQAAEDEADKIPSRPPDRSMLEALGGPGERSILSQKEGKEEKDDSVGDGESRDATEEAKEEEQRDESPGSRGSTSVGEDSEDEAEKREEEGDHEEKRVHLEDEHMIKDKKGARSGEERDAPRIKSKEKKSVEEDKRSAYFSHGPKPEEEEEEGEMKRDGHESHKRWTKRGKSSPGGRKKAVGEEAPHHSKEERQPEARGVRTPHKCRDLPAGQPETGRERKQCCSFMCSLQEPGIESLAAIESELENVAQKLHEMRRG